ncbi:uncharacterized protein G2W53_008101 [Senna tora]|uniref:Uncharacterized protein n=1 Tax=Senna tora TaxID=362788 RepID=A0A834X7P2_9FABA|nr:uncharacterized protein G2W53_008101 [Senna tora]
MASVPKTKSDGSGAGWATTTAYTDKGVNPQTLEQAKNYRVVGENLTSESDSNLFSAIISFSVFWDLASGKMIGSAEESNGLYILGTY